LCSRFFVRFENYKTVEGVERKYWLIENGCLQWMGEEGVGDGEKRNEIRFVINLLL
jgi:hypothetical protein